jgi:ribosomal protein L11 methyltransferase
MSSGAWMTIRVTPSSSAHRELVSAAMFAAGAEGLHEDGDSFVTHVPATYDADIMCIAVTDVDSDAVVNVTPLPVEALLQPLHGTVTPHELGHFTIAPTWHAVDYDPARTIIVEPGMAFGTGEHATTRGVLRLLPAVLRAGDLVADLGAGSAVLAIAAAKGGAGKVIAIELDEDAMSNAEANVALNDVGDRVHLVCGDAATLLPFFAPVRLVLANIISSVHIELLPTVATCLAPDGHAIISGILLTEREMMLHVLAVGGWHVHAEDAEGEWWTATIARA